MILFAVVIVVVSNLYLADSYKPVMIVPGLSSPLFYSEYKNQILQKHPDTDVVIASCDPTGVQSLLPTWKQVENTYNCRKVQRFVFRNCNGFIMIGISLGSIIGCALIEVYGLPVDTFISVAGLHLGMSASSFISMVFPVENVINSFTCFPPLNLFFIAGVWRDSCKINGYLECNDFLPYINNEIQHNDSKKYKNNFLRIKKMYLLSNINDKLLSPWQTGRFGYVDCDGNEVEMKDQEVYKNDSFGLRTLDQKKGIEIVNIPEPFHIRVITQSYIKKYIIPIIDKEEDVMFYV